MSRVSEIDDYIDATTPSTRQVLKKIRATIRKSAPHAEERLSYRMPSFFQDGILIHYGAFKSHIGLFPPVRGDAALMKAIEPYAGPKGNLQLPLDRPIPYALITRIVKARLKLKAVSAKAKAKRR